MKIHFGERLFLTAAVLGRVFAVLFVLAVALTLVLILGNQKASAGTYKVHTEWWLSCNGGDWTEGTADDSCLPGSAYRTDTTADFGVSFWVASQYDPGAPHKHTLFGYIAASAVPPKWELARGSDVADGTLVGTLISGTSVSILNGVCAPFGFLTFQMYDASTDTSNEIGWVGNGSNLLADWDGNGLPAYIDKYPSYLHNVTEPENWGGLMPPLKPRSRLAGHTNIYAGSPPTYMEYLVFEPGQLSQMMSPAPERNLSDSHGYVSAVVLDNPWRETGASSGITEFCEPLATSTVVYGKSQGFGQLGDGPIGSELNVPCTDFNDEDPDDDPGMDIYVNDGCPAVGISESDIPGACDGNNFIDNDGDGYYNDGCPKVGTNPEPQACAADPGAPGCGGQITFSPGLYAGVFPIELAGGFTRQSADLVSRQHISGAYSQSYRDFDLDGISNQEDGCPFSVPLDPNATLDFDTDGLQDDCDPTPSGGACPSPYSGPNDDCDNDGVQNRLDNCPLDWNPMQEDSDALLAADGGPPDGIGDACDPNPLSANTEGEFIADYARNQLCLSIQVEDGRLDINNDFTFDANDDGTVWWDQFPVFIRDGLVDIDGNTIVDGNDDQADFYNRRVIDGYLDMDDDNDPSVPDTGDDGYWHADDDGDGWCNAQEFVLGSLDIQSGGLVGESWLDCYDTVDNDSDGYTDSADAGCSTPEHIALDPPIPGIPGTCNNHVWEAVGEAAGPEVDENGWGGVNGDDPGCVSFGSYAVIDGYVDLDGDTVVPDVDYDGSVYNVAITDSCVDTDPPDGCELKDNGDLGGFEVIGGRLDMNGDGTITTADDGVLADPDKDFKFTGRDNCSTTYNPEQINIDGDVQGDACDGDDDNDGYRDRLEYLYGGQPKNATRYDWAAFGLDIDGNTLVQVGDVLAFKGNTSNNPVPQAGTVP